MANIPLQYPFPYKTTNNTGFTSSVEFNTVTVLGDVTIDQNLTVAGNITTTDLTVGDDLTVGGTIDAQALRAFGIWDSPTATVTGAGAWIGFDTTGHTIFANRKSTAGQTNSFRWYAYDEANSFQGELMRLSNAGNLFISGTRIEFPLIHFQQPPGTYPTYDFILPSSMGGAGQVLTSAGAGNPTYWTTPSGGVTNVTGTSPVTVTSPTTTPNIALSTIPTTLGGTGLTTVGTNGQVLTSDGTTLSWQTPTSGGVTSVTATSPIVSSGGTTPDLSLSTVPTTLGGTGLTTVGTNGQVLTSNGTTLSWQTPSGGSGTVTSVSASVPAFLSVTVNNPTTTPDIAISGTSTGTGSVVLQTSPTINDTLAITNPTTTFFDSLTSYAPNLGASNGNYIRFGKNSTSGEHAYLYYITQATTSGKAVALGMGSTQIRINGAGQFTIPGGILSTTSWSVSTNVNIGSGATLNINNSSTISSNFTNFSVLAPNLQSGVGIQIRLGTATSDNTGITFGWKTNTTVADRYAYFETASVERLVINTGGNIGIGTSTPAQRLQVIGNVAATTSVVGGSAGFISANVNRTWTAGVRGDIGDSYNIVDETALAGRLSIDSSGNVGIGTLAPSYKLHVEGAGYFNTQFYLDSPGTNDGYLTFVSVGGANYIQSALEPTSGSAADLYFTDFNAANTWMTIKDTGDVGIGTTAPGCKVDVLTTLGNTTMRLKGTPESLILDGTDHVFMRYAWAGVNKAYVGFGNAGDPNFDISNAATGGHINLFPNANVGIGTTSPTEKLHVAGTITASRSTDCNILLNPQVSGSAGIDIRAIGSTAYLDLTGATPSPGADYDMRISRANGSIHTNFEMTVAGGGGYVFDRTIRAPNFTTNAIHTFTYSETDFTPTIGFLTGATNNFVEAAVGATITSFSYNFQTGRITRIGSIMTVVVDISFNITMSVAAAPGIYIAIRLPAECRANSLGATAGGSWPQTVDPGNFKGYVLLNGTDSGGNIAYISPVSTSERLLWSIYGTSPQTNQRLFATMTYILR